MKIFCAIATVCLLAVSHFARADFKVPTTVFNAAQLDKAVAKAKAEKKPIAFMMSDKDTTCPLCSNASGQIMNSLRTPAVVVYVKEWKDLPAPAATILKAADRGKYIPWVGVMDVDCTKLLGIVTYEEIKAKGPRAFTDVRKAIASYKTSS